MESVIKVKKVKYDEEQRRLEKYRRACKDEAFDMLKKYFYDLWY